MTKIELMEKALREKTQTPWSGHGNLPFNATLEKPAPSLSKHDHERPDYWRCEDVNFVLHCANGGVQALFDEIARLKVELENK